MSIRSGKAGVRSCRSRAAGEFSGRAPFGYHFEQMPGGGVYGFLLCTPVSHPCVQPGQKAERERSPAAA